jgi:hypothetical protein
VRHRTHFSSWHASHRTLKVSLYQVTAVRPTNIDETLL